MNSIESEFLKVLQYCEGQRDRLPEHLLQQSRRFHEGLYRTYEDLLDVLPVPLEGKTVVDFGCKYGHLIPLLVARGVREAIGIDAEDDYVSAGKSVFEALYSHARIIRSEAGHFSLQPETVDIIIMNEVISHVNPSYLDTVWSEASRVLKPGGILFISDGNNLAHPASRARRADLYDKWENGPDGASTDRDVVTTSFINRRRKLIRERHPGLPAATVEHAAANTSGLFGEQLGRVVDRYVATGELARRPYRKGACPTNPQESGAVMERAFFPQQLELALVEYGFEARQVVPRQPRGRSGLLGPARDLYAWLRQALRAARNPEWYRSAEEGFQILAVRK